MISMYKWQQIKALRAAGRGIKSIAKKIGVSKNTVRRYLRSAEPPQFKTREYEKMLDGYGDEIKEMLIKRYIGTRIFSELSKIGYQGSLSTVHRYIHEARREEEISSKVTTRVETPPGKQMQYDWKEWDLPVCGKTLRIYLHEVVLSYSRKKGQLHEDKSLMSYHIPADPTLSSHTAFAYQEVSLPVLSPYCLSPPLFLPHEYSDVLWKANPDSLSLIAQRISLSLYTSL